VQSLLRPWLFYGVVSFLLGFTILYVLTTLGGALGAAGSVRYLRGLHVVALTPPLTAFLFVAASANTVNAWLGGMRLSRQTAALEALGIPRSSYLWAPLWVALTLAFVIVAATFALGLVVGGVALCSVEGINHGWELLTSDLLDPVPARAPYVVRAVALCFIYAVGCASDAIARGDDPKETADDVTRAMTRSVISCTLWVAVLELVSLVLVRLVRGTL
jgi:phospholipid/cholesterol/gamma-HCH transport system permease protein